MDTIRIGTTFSGIGAPEQALKTLGIPHVVAWACDIDKHAKETYYLNHSCEKWYDDITTINPTELADVDLYVFGFPCQDVSVCGKQNLSKGRTALVEYSLRIIEHKRPAYILFENVKGLLSKKFQPFLNSILARLSENYNLDMAVLNSKFFGSPQNRERVFCLGTRKDIPAATLPKQDKSRFTHLSSVLETSVAPCYTLSDTKWHILQAHKARHMLQGNGFGYRFLTDRAYTLLTTYWPIPYQLIEQPGKNPRRLTERECARLQGFPDTFKLHPTPRHAYKQLGNSITVHVLAEIFRGINFF